MDKIILPRALLVVLWVTCIISCKTNNLVQGSSKPKEASIDAAIAKLPASQKVERKEIMDWKDANLQTSALRPQWDKMVQTILRGRQAVKIPVQTDLALFFIRKRCFEC